RGSLRLDLATAVDHTLLSKHPATISTGIKGPITINGQAVGALLIGRSLVALKGLTVITGLIDADFQGEILIMVQTLFPPLFIPKGTRVAQPIPLPHLAEGLPPSQSTPRTGGFGSTGQIALLTVDLQKRPRHTVTASYQGQSISLVALLDTGVDVYIIG
ncbi:POK9 protein, partial [Urocolius indicus]|nr:POK9 protein [Urocolius indicus]